jgi:orotidine-5'-phosphate decarboxylase
MSKNENIVVALDTNDAIFAQRLLGELSPYVNYFKVGLALSGALGRRGACELVKSYGAEVFLDEKYLDIPQTMRSITEEISSFGISMFTIHCLGGESIMKAAQDGPFRAIRKGTLSSNKERPLIFGVTLLTSMSIEDIYTLGINCYQGDKPNTQLELLSVRYSELAMACGLDGVIASPLETERIREVCGDDLLIATPGIRPSWYKKDDDQVRTATPTEAVIAGSDFLIIGRPITNADNPKEAFLLISSEVEIALRRKYAF